MRGLPATLAGRLAMLALAAMAVTHAISVIVLDGSWPPLAIIMELIMLALAASLMLGRWWVNAIAAVISGLLFLLTLSGSMSRLADPGSSGFLSAVIFLALTLLAAVAAAWAAVQARQAR